MSKATIEITRFTWLVLISVGATVLIFIGPADDAVAQQQTTSSIGPPIPDAQQNLTTVDKQPVPVPAKSNPAQNVTPEKAPSTNPNSQSPPQKPTKKIRSLPRIEPTTTSVVIDERLQNDVISQTTDTQNPIPQTNYTQKIRPLPAIKVGSTQIKPSERRPSQAPPVSNEPPEIRETIEIKSLPSSNDAVAFDLTVDETLELSSDAKPITNSRSNEPEAASFRIEMAQDLEEPRDPNSMWWHTKVIVPLDQRNTELINPDILLHHALQNSPFILAISKSPLIRQTNVGEACAKFDPELFLLSQFDDRYDPVGNQLTTGTAASFLKDHIWSGDLGVRRKLTNGATVEARQQFGFQNSNSSFFDPQDQGTATLSLNYAQPLLKGRGSAYNRHQILIAQLDSTASWDSFAAELQDELTKIVEAYWNLYFHRARLLQKENNVKRGEEVLRKLEARSALDSLPSQIARARSAVQLRRTELANARRDIKNAETNIRRLIGSPENFQATAPELLPEEAPSLIEPQRDLASVIEQAIQLRPEIKQAIQRGKVAAVQKRVSEHELLPELNLIFNTYVAALKGDSDILGAWGDQFTGSSPGYGVGFEFNTPYYRRAARSINKRQGYVLDQVRHEIDQTVNNVVAEAQIAWRQVDSAYQTVISAAAAISAARTDLLQNEARWNSFALIEGDLSEGQNPTTLLDQLLDAQQRLANAELTYSESLLEFKRAEVELKRATGQLLSHGPFKLPSDIMPSSNLQSLPASPTPEILPAPQSR